MNKLLRVINLGAGVQSSTLLMKAVLGEIQPRPDIAIFSDTQAEQDWTYDYLEYLKGLSSIPVEVVTQGDLKTEASDIRVSKKSGRTYWRNMIPWFVKTEPIRETEAHDERQSDAFGGGWAEYTKPPTRGILRRKCTRDHKIAPIKRRIRQLMKEGGYDSCEQWFGISLDEIQRVKTSEDAWTTFRYPLIEAKMTRQHCLEWMEAHKYRRPPRSACYFCPYHSDDEWLRIKHEDPEAFAAAIVYEQQGQASADRCEVMTGVPYLHSSLVPLGEVDFSAAKTDPRQATFVDECEGFCGV